MSQPKIAHYQLQSRLGQGAMGIVFRARDERLERDVALKLLQVTLASHEAADYAARLLQEARSAARLNHPGIITVYDCGEWKGQSYLAMELVHGITLKDWMEKRGPLSIRQVISIARQMFAALGHAHRHKVIHRDIKPANLMLTKEGRLKITDFGIAQLPASDLTRTGTVLGSPRYMSPEQLAGQKLDGRADLYSAGVVLYQCLTGVAPFNGETTMNIVYQVLHTTPPAPHEVRPDVPRALSDLVMRCIAKQPDQRFATLDNALAALLGGEVDPQRADVAPEEPTQVLNATQPMGSPAGTSSPVLPWLAQTGTLLGWLSQHAFRAAQGLGRWIWRFLQAVARFLQQWTPVLWAKSRAVYLRCRPYAQRGAQGLWQRFRALPAKLQTGVAVASCAVLVWGLWPRAQVSEIEFSQSASAESSGQISAIETDQPELQSEQAQRNRLLSKMAEEQTANQSSNGESNEAPQLTAPPLPKVVMSEEQEQRRAEAAPKAEKVREVANGLGGQLKSAGKEVGRSAQGLFDCVTGQGKCPKSSRPNTASERRP